MKPNEPEKTIESLELEIAEAEAYLDILLNSATYHPEEISDTKEHITSLTWDVKARKAMDTLNNQTDHSFGVSRTKTKFEGTTDGQRKGTNSDE